jgi:hypothetical protein
MAQEPLGMHAKEQDQRVNRDITNAVEAPRECQKHYERLRTNL